MSKYEPVKLDDATKDALEEKHEDILVLTGDAEMSPWLVVVRRPTRQETLGYKQHAKRDQTTANEQLIRKLTVYPSGEELEKQHTRWPFFPDGIVSDDKFSRFMGLSVEASLK
jgi:hypothetical protein